MSFGTPSIELSASGCQRGCESLQLREVCTFFSDYAVILFGSGATCIRMDRNIRRMAVALGVKVEFSILPRHIHITIDRPDNEDCEAVTSVVTIREMPISFSKIASLSKLSWQMHDGIIDFRTARHALTHIAHTSPTNPILLLFAVSAANASFCRLFGGDFAAVMIVFVATIIGFLIRQALLHHHVDFRLVVIICSFVSALIASADFLYGLGATPELSIGASVLYLIPGIPLINSFCDAIDRHYLCALGRAVHALILLGGIALGLSAAISLMHLNFNQLAIFN